MLMYEKNNSLNIKFNPDNLDLDNPDLSISEDGIMFNGSYIVKSSSYSEENGGE